MRSQKDIILGRSEHQDVICFPDLLPKICHHKILITGARGSIGQRLSLVLENE